MSNLGDGYIILSRSLVDSVAFKNEKWLKVWLWCLFEANFKSNTIPINTGKGMSAIKVERGQFVFGRNKHSKELGLKPSTLWKIILKLKSMGNLNIKSNSHCSIITVCNYDLYQDISNYKVTGKVTGKEQASDRQGTQHKERKERKEGNEIKKPSVKKGYSEEFENWWKIFKGNPTHGKGDKSKAFTEFKKIKPDHLPDLMKGTENYSNSTDGSYKAMNFLKQGIWKLHIVPQKEQNTDQEQEQNPNKWHEPQTAKQA